MLQNVHSSECNNVIMPKISVYQKFKIILKKLLRANFPKRGFKFELNITESNYNNLIFNRIINNGNRTKWSPVWFVII